jgi:hypothetical protein
MSVTEEPSGITRMAIGAGVDDGIDLYKGITRKNGEETAVGSIKSGAAVAVPRALDYLTVALLDRDHEPLYMRK